MVGDRRKNRQRVLDKPGAKAGLRHRRVGCHAREESDGGVGSGWGWHGPVSAIGLSFDRYVRPFRRIWSTLRIPAAGGHSLATRPHSRGLLVRDVARTRRPSTLP